jgi:hypothetical protein
MSVTLQDRDGAIFKMSVWSWGLLHHTFVLADLFDDDTSARLRAGQVVLSEQQVEALVAHLEEGLLPEIPPGQRLLHDFTLTRDPDDGTFHRDHLERNYSLDHSVLTDLIAFLKQAVPPITRR